MKWVLALVLIGCASENSLPVPNRHESPPPTVPVYKVAPLPDPEPAKECVVVGTESIQDCILVRLQCDGESDMTLLCPTRYTDYQPEVPMPVDPSKP